MAKKQFKAESKKLLDLMINSIYTNKDIFLRELISNASDAIDKLYYRSLTDDSIKVNHSDLEINISVDKEKRLLTISDNGCGMTKEELEENLGTICKSGSEMFKNENEKKKDINIIGQFGVGFYSSFMVSDEVTVVSKSVNSDEAYTWKSTGIDGYSIEKSDKKDVGTCITLKIKEDTEGEEYSKYLEEYEIKSLVKKYSDYITYPIKMECIHKHLKEGTKDEYEDVKENETLNTLVPIWKKDKKKIKEEEYNNFYMEKFSDYANPDDIIHINAEGLVTYDGILFIPSHTPFNYYSKEYEKGLQLYSNGVLIMDKCGDLIPDYFSFVKGVVDSPDLKLNISRETLQQNRILKTIAKNIESKIKKELEDLRDNNREKYEKIFENFGIQLKYGVYNNFGMDKDKLQDLLLFYSSSEKKMVTLKEYVSRMKEEQKNIYFACGESIDKIDLLPQVELFKDKGYEILYLTEYVDEFTMQSLQEYDSKKIINVSSENADLSDEEDKKKLEEENKEFKDMFTLMKDSIGSVTGVKFTNRLKNHPVCLTNEGVISTGMEKTLNAISPEKVSAELILEINDKHPIADKLKSLYKDNKEELKEYSKILYAQARLIEGLTIDNPTEISNLICNYISK